MIPIVNIPSPTAAGTCSILQFSDIAMFLATMIMLLPNPYKQDITMRMFSSVWYANTEIKKIGLFEKLCIKYVPILNLVYY